MKNETTSKAVASIAGRIQKRLKGQIGTDKLVIRAEGDTRVPVCTVADLASLAGSCLTQRVKAQDGRLKRRKA